jgi:hypothetical protein
MSAWRVWIRRVEVDLSVLGDVGMPGAMCKAIGNPSRLSPF